MREGAHGAPSSFPGTARYARRVAYDDQDEWPEPERDPEVLENARRQLRSMQEMRKRLLRWTYAGLALLLILVIVLATTR